MPYTDIAVVSRGGRRILQVADRPPFDLDEEAVASLCRAAGRLRLSVKNDVDSGPPYCLAVRVPYLDHDGSDQETEAYETYVAFDRRAARDAALVAVRGELAAMGFTEARGYKGSDAVELTAPSVPEETFGHLEVSPDADVALALADVRWRLCRDRSGGRDDLLPSWWRSFGIDVYDFKLEELDAGHFTDARKAAIAAAAAAVGGDVTWRRIESALVGYADYTNPKKSLKVLEAKLAAAGGRGVELADHIDDLRIACAASPHLEKTAPSAQKRGRR